MDTINTDQFSDIPQILMMLNKIQWNGTIHSDKNLIGIDIISMTLRGDVDYFSTCESKIGKMRKKPVFHMHAMAYFAAYLSST